MHCVCVAGEFFCNKCKCSINVFRSGSDVLTVVLLAVVIVGSVFFFFRKQPNVFQLEV